MFAAILGFQVQAQTVSIRGGLSLANMLDRDNIETYSSMYSNNVGWHLGMLVDFPLGGIASLETGVVLTTKGMKVEEEFFGIGIEARARMYYLDVPVLLKVTAPISGKVDFYATAGPYMGYGMSGNIEATLRFMGMEETESEDISFGNDKEKDTFKPLEFGLSFGGGLQVNAFVIGMSYDLGLTNISVYQKQGTTVKNRILKFSVGYRFSGNG